jgi:tetratricopeptide (TPR) repeat protein
VAKTTLIAFAAGDTGQGVDRLMAQAQAKTAAAAKSAAEDYKAAGALAFPSDTTRAVAAYEAALKLAPGDPEVLTQLSSLYAQRLGRYDDALRVADLEIASADASTKARGYLDRGNALTRREGYEDDKGAEAAYRTALDIATANKLKLREAQALNNLGNIGNHYGDLAAAEGYYKRALAMNIELGRKRGQAANLNNLGNVARDREDYAAAEDYHKRALAIYTGLDNKFEQARTLTHLGSDFFMRNDFVATCDYYRRAIALYESVGAGASKAAGLTRSDIASFCKN